MSSPRRGGIAGIVVIIFSLLVIFGTVYAIGLLKNSQTTLKTHASTEADVEAATLALFTLDKTYKTAATTSKSTSLVDLVTTAKQRKDNLLKLMTTNPSEVLKVALPAKVRQSLSPEVQPYLESDAIIESKIAILHYDNKDKTSKYEYIIKDSQNKRITLHFATDAPDVKPGSIVKISGVRLENEIAIQSGKTSTTNTGFKLVQTMSTPPAVGTKKVAVILFNFQSDQSQPWTPSQIRSWTFLDKDSVNSFFKEASFGKINLAGKIRPDGDVFGWLTVPYNNNICNTYVWSQSARQTLQASGQDLSGYDIFIYAFPTVPACGHGGWASISSDLDGHAEQFINGSYKSYYSGEKGKYAVVTHETGHNLGLDHALSYTCYDSNNQLVPYSTICNFQNYGDPFDVMGFAWDSYHFNNYHKGILGWYGSTNIQNVQSSGIYILYPPGITTSQTQILTVPHQLATNILNADNYFLEYRRPFGTFDNFNSTDPVVNGITIRLGSPYSSAILLQSLLLDITTINNYGFYDSALAVGKSFLDPVYGIRVTTLSADSNKATVKIDLGLPVGCSHRNPQIEVSPPAQWAEPGQTLSYRLTVSNIDTSVCPASVFSLKFQDTSNGVLSSPSPLVNSPSLPPGSSYTTTLQINSKSDTPIGMYTFRGIATNTTAPQYSTSTLSVFANIAPPTSCIRNNPNITLSPQSVTGNPGQKISYKIVVYNNDGSYCPPSTFSIIPTLPSSWSQSPSSISTQPFLGGRFEQNVEITSPTNAVSGQYLITQTIKNTALPQYISSANLYYVIPPFDFSLTNDGNKSINPGEQATATITSTKLSGTAQQVNFTVSGLPANTTASFNPTSCSRDCLTFLTINTTSSTPPGSYPVIITGTSGSLSKTTTLNLSVKFPTKCSASGAVCGTAYSPCCSPLVCSNPSKGLCIGTGLN